MTIRFPSHAVAVLLALAPADLLGATRELRITSSLDGSEQPAFFHTPENVPYGKTVPLLVVLHSWSADYRQKLHKPMEDHCVRAGWAYLHPNFRGPNRNPQATGSELAVQDILDAVAYAKKNAPVDEKKVLLVGTSGGGYMSLLMAGRAPEVWAGVSAWVPISDLVAWHAETKRKGLKYAREIEKSCGGPPGASPEVDKQYRLRSPLSHLFKAKGVVNLDLNAGIRDGHDGSVPVSHSLHAFNLVALEKDRVPNDLIDELTRTAKIPAAHLFPGADTSYGNKRPLFRRTSGKARLTLFEGGHEIVHSAALNWLLKQAR